jgi:methionine aminotransferase
MPDSACANPSPAPEAGPTPAELLGPSKLPGVGTTIFTLMSQLAAERGAINLGQGFPDFDGNARLHQLVTEAMAGGRNQYAPMSGIPELRRAVAAKVERLHGHRYDADSEITVTAGATQAILTAILAIVRDGDEVIVLEPAYDSYGPAIALAGGRVVGVPLDHARGYRADWERVEAAITARTRLLIVNSPHNPTGTIFDADDIAALEAIVARHGIFLLADEVYEHIVFDGHAHRSVAGSPALAARAFVISSFGKTFHTTGWKIGTCCAPAALSAEFRKVHQFNVFAVNHPMQAALAAFLADPAPYLELGAFYQAKRDRFLAGLARTRFRALPCPGTYFVLADYRAISDEPEAAFARRLVEQHGVAAIPVSAFYRRPFDNGIVRFCFGKREATLDAGLARLQQV